MEVPGAKVALAAKWQKYSVTAEFPSTEGKTVGTNSWFSADFWFDAGPDFDDRSLSLGHQSGTFDIAQVKLEDGVAATPFVPRAPGEELALCRRYFRRSPVGVTGYQLAGHGFTVEYPTGRMRVSPSRTFVAGTVSNSTGTFLGGTNESVRLSAAAASTFVVQHHGTVFEDAEL